MREADRIYLSKFSIDPDLAGPDPDREKRHFHQKDMFLDDDTMDDLDFDNWFEME